MKSYIIADYMFPDEGEENKWGVLSDLAENQVRSFINQFNSKKIGAYRVYEFDEETGQIREVNTQDLEEYKIEVKREMTDEEVDQAFEPMSEKEGEINEPNPKL